MLNAEAWTTTDDAVVQLRRLGKHIAIVTLNRPQVRNAVNAAVAQALDRVVKMIESTPDIRVAILTGAGRDTFCAGADLKEIHAGAPADARMTPDGGFAGFVFAPRRKVWIAAVNGTALAGGFELVLACDMVVASTEAVFGLPEVKRGRSASAGGTFRLPRALPRALAIEMIATGDPIAASRAFELGLINRLTEPENVLAEAVEIAETISANAPLAVAWSLEVARRAFDAGETALRRHASEVADRIDRTEDAREGPRAYVEKRAPRWIGR